MQNLTNKTKFLLEASYGTSEASKLYLFTKKKTKKQKKQRFIVENNFRKKFKLTCLKGF